MGVPGTQQGTPPGAGQAPASSVPQLPADLTHDTYNRFVSSPDDLIGLIAYSLYKQQKIDFLKQRRIQLGGARPPEAEVVLFCSTFQNEMQVEMLQGRAAELLNIMMNEVLRSRETAIRQQYNQRLTEELKQGKSWSRAIMENTAANMLSAGLLALLALLYLGSKMGFVEMFKDLLNKL
ncbi:MAG: hypothetical protein EON54_07740 [Alcaligenaceae bacterium]|nr:MAG: hypothetical protein EON54_07740 [Alcaligenaceae bacterium]